MDASKLIKVLDMVAEDVENDTKNFEGKTFNGRNVGEYFGNHGAAIHALALVLKEILEDSLEPDEEHSKLTTDFTVEDIQESLGIKPKPIKET